MVFSFGACSGEADGCRFGGIRRKGTFRSAERFFLSYGVSSGDDRDSLPAADDQRCLLYEGNRLMDSIRQYLLSIIVAALVCSIVKALVGSKSGYGRVVSLVCGTFMTITLLSPWVNWDFKEFALPSDGLNAEGDSIARQAQEETRNELRSIIKERTEAYILDKALSMDADVQVDVIYLMGKFIQLQ